MGATCCKGNDQKSLLSQELLTALLAQQIYSEQQIQFLGRYPKMAKVLDRVIKELPKNWLINRQLQTKFRGQGLFIGKKDITIRAGYGIMLYDVGFYYIGGWHDGYRNGMGCMIDKNGNLYKGQWSGDQAQGYGEYYDGQLNWNYKGKWKASKKEGLGEETFPDGTKYVGSYLNDVKNGMGKFIFDKRCCYQGHIQNDVVSGHGRQIGLDYMYSGPWKQNQMHGAGQVQYYDENNQPSDRYVGEFKKGIKHGYGQYTWANGPIYKGKWSQGGIANHGVLIEKKNKS